jgi:hypothetical protein
MASSRRRPWWRRLAIGVGTGLGVGLLVAIALTLVDLYQAGHGKQLLGRPWLDLDQPAIHLSRADVVFLLAAVLGFGCGWRRTARR